MLEDAVKNSTNTEGGLNDVRGVLLFLMGLCYGLKRNLSLTEGELLALDSQLQ
jgi:hypothetical protein